MCIEADAVAKVVVVGVLFFAWLLFAFLFLFLELYAVFDVFGYDF